MTKQTKEHAITVSPVQGPDLLVIALQNNAAIDVIERLAALQRESLARAAETEFSEALNRVQAEIQLVKPDLMNSQTHSRYPSYAALDKEVRPLYSKEGFSLSFDEGDSDKPDHIRVLAYLRRGAHKEIFRKDIAVNTKGIRGSEMMTVTHAEGSANSYGKRYLLCNIFNIAVGELLEPEDDGNAAGKGNPESELVETIVAVWKARILSASSLEEFKRRYIEAFQVASAAGLSKIQLEQLSQAKDEAKKKFPNGVDHAAPAGG